MAIATRPHPEFPDIDEDLLAETCLGSGVQYPQLWAVVKRYILRGDSWFRSGGLAVLAATVENLPLEEAAGVLEELWDKVDSTPGNAATGLLDPTAIRAVHAVATTAQFPQGAPTPISNRMVALLERTLQHTRDAGAASVNPKFGPTTDRQQRFLENTINAIRMQRPFPAELPLAQQPVPRS